MKKEDSSDHDGGGAYEGFCIDLLNELRGKLHFDYELQLRKEIGAKKPDGTWGGMIGELTRKVRNHFHVTTSTYLPITYNVYVMVAVPKRRIKCRMCGVIIDVSYLICYQ